MGKEPKFGQFPVQRFSGDGSTTSFTLSQVPATNTSLLVTISGVKQQTSAYSVTDTALDFGGGNAPPSGTNNIEVVYMGQRALLGGVADDAITTAKIVDDAVTAAKIAANAVTTTEIINDAVTIAKLAATGTASATTFLRGDNAWSAIAGGLSDSSQWRLTTDFAAASDPTIITSNLEEVDTDGYGRLGSAMTEASGVFSFPSTGIWLIKAAGGWENNGESKYNIITIDTTVDDGTWTVAATAGNFIRPSSGYGECWALAIFQFDVTDVSTHKVRFKVDCGDNATTCMGNTNINETSFTFTKLGDT